MMVEANNNNLQIREKTITDGIFAKYILKSIFKTLFAITGWTAGPAPGLSGVAIGAPHTSNWDFIYGIGAAIILDVKVYFSIKDSWCRLPLIGRLIMYMGAIPIDRSTPGKGQVEQISGFARQMKNQRVYFAFTPEGTRSKVTKWKTGFYHVAQDCGLPLHLGQLDYLNKVVSIFHTFEVTGDKEHDVAVIQEAYKLIHGCNTDKQYPDYSGSVPDISQAQANLMKAMYQLGSKATVAEITTKINVKQLASSSINELLGSGFLEEIKTADSDAAYQLTYKGKGGLLHLFPTLH